MSDDFIDESEHWFPDDSSSSDTSEDIPKDTDMPTDDELKDWFDKDTDKPSADEEKDVFDKDLNNRDDSKSSDKSSSDKANDDKSSKDDYDKNLSLSIEKYLNLGLKSIDQIVTIATGRRSEPKAEPKAKPKEQAYDDIPIKVPTSGKKVAALPPKREKPASEDDHDAAVIDDVQSALEREA